MFYWFLKTLVAQPLFSAWWRPWVQGEENLPDTGAAILVANHLSEGETVLLPAILKRRLVFTPKVELFNLGGFKGWIFRWFLNAIKMLPLDRSGGKKSADDMGAFAKVLSEGSVVIMFPEGGRSPDGRLYKGRTGAARLALQAGVPIIPVAVFNTYFSKGLLRIPRLVRPGIRIGKPLDFSPYRCAGNDRDTLRYLTDELMNAIMELSGQTYVDTYVSAVKAELRRGVPIEQIDAPVLPRPGYGRPVPPDPGREVEAA
ncbi:MAG: 1-acyl-sn-glycerol-3-phosphate acyltransferase [Microlunatus sp.]|nr:1-acyl-sn-glycerol-3-phosphate acyltransferase [Microlunatus sp.]